MKTLTCGCCDGHGTDDKCCCEHHMDIPRGLRPQKCLWHRLAEEARTVWFNQAPHLDCREHPNGPEDRAGMYHYQNYLYCNADRLSFEESEEAHYIAGMLP